MKVTAYILSLLLIFGSNTSMILNKIGRYYPENVGREATKRVAIDEMMDTMYVINTDDMTIDMVMIEMEYDDDNETIINVDFNHTESLDIKQLINPSDITSIKYDMNMDRVYLTVIPSNISNPGSLLSIDVMTNKINSTTLKNCYSPKHSVLAANGSKVIIACSGQEIDYYDPKIIGSINIVDTQSWESINYDLSDIGNDGAIPLRNNAGIYRSYDNDNIPFAIEAEPEYVSLDKNESYLYVTLQKVNAVAIFSMNLNVFSDVIGLGFKSYSMNGTGLDASDRDNMINIQPYPGLFGIRQPSMVEYYNDDENSYLISINRGSPLKYDAIHVNDTNVTLNATLFSNLYAEMNITLDELTSDQLLGRLMISKFEGINSLGEYDSLYTFGSRDFSLYQLDDAMNATLIYESNDAMSQITAKELGYQGFNSEEEFSPSNDAMSVNYGPEPFAAVTGKCIDQLQEIEYIYLFISSLSTGGIFVYDISNIADDGPILMQYINNRNFDDSDLYFNMSQRPMEESGDIGTEQLIFLSGMQPMLVSVNGISSSITTYSINCTLSTPLTTKNSDGSNGDTLDETTEKLVILILAIVFGVVLLAGIIIFIYFKCFEGPRQKVEAPRDYVELQ